MSGTLLARVCARLSVRRHGAKPLLRSALRCKRGNKAGRAAIRRVYRRAARPRKGVEQMSHIQLYERDEVDYGSDSFRRSEEIKFSKRRKFTHGRKRGKSPVSVNGIHRRRNRKIAW
jgi:hypothetical protein